MPIIKFKCNNLDCNNEITKYFKTNEKIPPFLNCGECGTGKLEKQLSAPGSNKIQIVDNGVQARQVELMDEVVEKEQDKLNNGE